MHFPPFLGAFLALADLFADFRGENFRAAAGDGSESGLPQGFQGGADGLLENPQGEVPNFHRGKGFHVEFRVQSP
jgi:hypothetical protein